MGICVEVGQGRYISNPLNEVIVQPGYTAGVIFLWVFPLGKYESTDNNLR